MKAAAFDYQKVTSIEQAIGLLKDFGDNAKLMAGGQSLLPALNMRLSAPELLIDLGGIAELKGIERRQANGRDVIFIGAMTTHTEIENSELIATKLPMLKKAVPHIAHRAIRNLGTWGGSIVLGDPAAEWPACAVALGGVMQIVGPNGQRSVPADVFFHDLYTTDLKEGEILLGTEFTLPSHSVSDYFEELSRRHGDYAIAGLTMQLEHQKETIVAARIVYFSIASTPMMATQAQNYLVGKHLSHLSQAEVMAECQTLVRSEIQTMADLTNSAKMKTHLMGVLMARACQALASE